MSSNKENRSTSASRTSVKSDESKHPYIRIVEQPQSHGLRFRYQCEQRRSIIEGENSQPKKKTYPTIEIVNNKGPAFVVVSCVTKDYPHRPHPHSIEGKGKEFSHGICFMKVPAGENTVVFPRLTITCVKKNQIASALEERKRLKVNPFMAEYSDDLKSIDMSSVRLCFQVFLEGKQKGNFNAALRPVVSQPIHNKRMLVEFEIKWISHHSASVAGGKVICIISDRMVKDDIEVKFFCKKSGWEASAEFVQPFFHKQVAVVLKTPAYLDQQVTEPIEVQVMLRRPTNGTTSLPVPFQLLPVESTIQDSQLAKRLRLSKNPRPASTILEQHKMMENHQASARTSRKVTVSKENRVSQAQHSKNRQNNKVKERNQLQPQREFSNQINFQVPPPSPKTPAEFKQVLDHYLYGGQRPDFSS